MGFRKSARRARGNLNMGIARAHEVATQLVGMQLAAANLLAISVSAASIVAGCVTYAVINQPGNVVFWVVAGVIGAGLAILIEGMTLGALIRIRLANKQIRVIVLKLEAEQEVARAAGGRVDRWQAGRRKRFLTKGYRKSRRYSLPLAFVGACASATAGGLFYHQILGSLGEYQSLAVSGLFALIVTGTFVSSELFKDVQEEAVREGFRGGSLSEEALREETYRQTNRAVATEVTFYLESQGAKDAIVAAASQVLGDVLSELQKRSAERVGRVTGVAEVPEIAAPAVVPPPEPEPPVALLPQPVTGQTDQPETVSGQLSQSVTGQLIQEKAVAGQLNGLVTGQSMTGQEEPVNSTMAGQLNQSVTGQLNHDEAASGQLSSEEPVNSAVTGQSEAASGQLIHDEAANSSVAGQVVEQPEHSQSLYADALRFMERDMLELLLHLPEPEQVELVELVETQGLMVCARLLQERYPRFASVLTPGRVGFLLARVKAAVQDHRQAVLALRQRSAPRLSAPAQETTTEPVKVIDLAGRRQSGQLSSIVTGQAEAASGQLIRDRPAVNSAMTGQALAGQLSHDRSAAKRSTQPLDDRPGRSGQLSHLMTGQEVELDTDELTGQIAAYRSTHPDAKQTDLASHLGMSERTLRRKLAAQRQPQPVVVEGTLSQEDSAN